MSKKYIDIECSVDDALDKIIDATSHEHVVRHLSMETCLDYIDITTIIYKFGEDEILSHVSNSAIEEEYFKRTPLGRVMSE